MTATNRTQIVRDCYRAYEIDDRRIIEDALSDGFTFSSPEDDLRENVGAWKSPADAGLSKSWCESDVPARVTGCR